MKFTWMKWSPRFTRCGADGRARDVGARINVSGSEQARQRRRQHPAAGSGPAEKPKADVAHAQGKNQPERIRQARGRGPADRGETAKLEKKEAANQQGNGADRAANGGSGRRRRKKQSTAAQNQASKRFMPNKHKRHTAPHFFLANTRGASAAKKPAGPHRSRREERAKMTARKTAKLENQQKGINQTGCADRKANGGR